MKQDVCLWFLAYKNGRFCHLFSQPQISTAYHFQKPVTKLFEFWKIFGIIGHDYWICPRFNRRPKTWCSNRRSQRCGRRATIFGNNQWCNGQAEIYLLDKGPFKLKWGFGPRKVNSFPLHPTVLERMKAETIPQMGEVKPYRPQTLAKHPQAEKYYK